MLEWLSSKVAVGVAVMLLLSATTAFFLGEKEYVASRELDSVARGIAEFIDSVFQLRGSADFKVSIEKGSDLVLPAKIAGMPYRLELRPDAVMLSQDGSSMVAHWKGTLHLWRYDGGLISDERIEELDEAHQSLEPAISRGFAVVLCEVENAGSSPTYVFAFPST